MHSSACERCHRRKVRCDKALPQCTPCTRANASCQYMTSEHQLRRRNTQKLERRIRDLELQNEALVSQARRNDGLHHSAPPQSSATNTAASPTAATPRQQAMGPEGSGNGGVAEQVMHMSLIAGGSDHFVGSASGILLANLLQNCQSPSSTVPNPDWNHNSHSGSQSPESVPPLPAKSHARNLVQAYCNHDHLCYPFLSIEKLQQSFDAVYDASAPSSPSDAFFVDMVLAIGTAQVHKFNWNGVYDAELHYNRAMVKLGDVMAHSGIERLQALLLVCQYRMGSTSRNTTASVWHLIGVAARMCLEMGLHRATTYSLPNDLGNVGRGVLEAMETKKRCFWSLVALDRVASIALGRPLAIQLEDIDADLPGSTLTDQEPASNYPTPTSPLETPLRAEGTAIFVHIVAYRILCGRILNALYRSPKHSAQHESSFERARHQLAEELQAWHLDTTKLPLLDANREGRGTFAGASSFRSPEWYKLLYHNAVLMLYRPSPCICDASRNSATLQQIFDSSREAINLYAALHRSKKMNYSWITMHAVFNAGLSHIYALRNHLQSMQATSAQQGPSAQLNPKPTIHQVVCDTRSCSKVLVAVSERWDAAKNCSDLFDKLSDAVISDIAEVSRSPPPVEPQQALNRSQVTPSSSTSLDLSGGYYDPISHPNYMHMTVDNTFRDCFGDLQDLALDEYHNDALSQLSQEWFMGLGDDILMGRDG